MRPAKVGDRSTLLNEASAMGQSIFRHVAALENAADSDELHVSLTGLRRRTSATTVFLECLATGERAPRPDGKGSWHPLHPATATATATATWPAHP